MLTQNLSENYNIFSEKQSYRLLCPDVRLDLRYLAITLSGNLRIIRKVKKAHVNRAWKLSSFIEAVTAIAGAVTT